MFASELKQNNFHSIVTHELFFHRFSFVCLFEKKSLKDIWKEVETMQQYLRDRNPPKKKYSFETERKETENILFQQNATK